jgi:dihydrodipicolinate synthase/N-acetylneuraminate lyase
VFRGVAVALATLFTADQEIDYSATVEHARRLVDLGVTAVVVAGTTAEVDALTGDERLSLLREVRAAIDGRVPVVVGTGATTARETARLTAAAVEQGVDAVLVRSPARVADPRPFYTHASRAASDVPLLAYHFPAVAPPGIPLEMLPELPAVGCKDSSGEPARLLRELDIYPGDIYVGSSALLSFAGPLGCTGAILALANAEPELCAQAFAGDAKAQRRLTASHTRSSTRFPHGLKELMTERFGTSPVARLG